MSKLSVKQRNMMRKNSNEFMKNKQLAWEKYRRKINLAYEEYIHQVAEINRKYNKKGDVK